MAADVLESLSVPRARPGAVVASTSRTVAAAVPAALGCRLQGLVSEFKGLRMAACSLRVALGGRKSERVSRRGAVVWEAQNTAVDGKKRKPRCMVVYASLFGVGAPEVLVIGVVALLVFGPKGLAEVARNLGKTLRAFQPTIRELQDVSREFKSTLEREIGLDEVTSSSNSVYRSRSIFNENQHTTSDPNGKPTAEAPLAVTESPEEQPQAQVTSETVTSPSPSQEASTTVSPQINTQTPSSENAGEGSK